MSADIGIDLGTTKIIAYDPVRGLLFREPNIVAVNNDTGDIVAIGSEAHKMLGKTPGYLTAVSPMADGVISDYRLTNAIIRHTLKKVCGESYIKPRVAICVPSVVTNVEQRAVVEAALAGGARKVYLIDEPVAAALGAGIDISKPAGRLICDIGGGTTDIALLSLSGVVVKHSVKLAGMRFDQEIAKYVRAKYSLLIGPRTSEEAKKEIGTCYGFDDSRTFLMKGRNVLTGLPGKTEVSWEELFAIMRDLADEIGNNIQKVLEKAPPELSGDLKENGMLLTGGGGMLHGLDRYFSDRFGISCTVSENAEECVAVGTAQSFTLTGYLRDCVSDGVSSTDD